MPGKTTFRLDVVLEAVRRRVAETSIRATADELGMSRSGLHVLLRGTNPHAATRAKLIAWYVERRKGGAARTVPAQDVDAALRLLVQYVVEDGRVDARTRRLHEIIRRFEAAAQVEGKSRD
jgi:hypothetical protein